MVVIEREWSRANVCVVRKGRKWLQDEVSTAPKEKGPAAPRTQAAKEEMGRNARGGRELERRSMAECTFLIFPLSCSRTNAEPSPSVFIVLMERTHRTRAASTPGVSAPDMDLPFRTVLCCNGAEGQ